MFVVFLHSSNRCTIINNGAGKAVKSSLLPTTARDELDMKSPGYFTPDNEKHCKDPRFCRVQYSSTVMQKKKLYPPNADQNI